ncbi:RAD52 DNA repair protein [Mycena albidolilacea]|uniref:RAD52 DNA repair protein n=1 Tax=Mycena albidolilacea TaxID=1033008 RepID=A0AAD7AJ49_9AGAR|nr:RAD52 DNA repair protein [Mycena albidolilacea]
MAGALSGHIINSYESSMSNQSICTDGLISFNPNLHGSFNPNMHSTQQSFSFNNLSHASTSMSESTYDRVSRLQAKLNQKLGPEFISQRPGPGGGPKLTYAEGWKVINVANEVFGFDGWSSNIVSLTTDYMDYNEETRRYNVGVSAVMRVSLKEGVFHEDVGYGMIENAKAKGMALDKCKKEAVTDGLKRTLRTFGNVLGNCLYDKQYTAEIVKIKVPPVKLDKGDLHRLPELSDKPPTAAASTSASGSTSASRSITATSTPVRAPNSAAAPQPQKWQPHQQPAKPISSVPRHIQPSGLQTPITTPAGERKVSFAPQVKADPQTKPPQGQGQMQPPPVPGPAADADDAGDDSFGFFSDDDAFLACVDMGEGDLGQPIDFEEGASTVSVGDEEKAVEAAPLPPQPEAKPAEDRYGPMGLGRTAQGQGTRPPQQQQQWGARTNAPPQQKAYVPNTSGATSAVASRTGAPKPVSTGETASSRSNDKSAASVARALAIANHCRPSTSNPNQQAPSAPEGGASAGGASTSALPPQQKRPSTPSVGGFHFPPGMPNPLLQNNGRPPPQGVKRGADAMMSSSTRSGGMGLSTSGSGGSAVRQPLGTLALDPQQQHQHQQGGSDPKRVRR